MPLYEYKCNTCGIFENIQSTTDDILKVCPSCGEIVEKIISVPGYFSFHGDGFYETDYKKNKKEKKEE